MWFYMHALKHFFIVFFILRITRPWKGFTLAGKLLRINRIFMLISTHESERVLWKMCQLFKRHRMSVSERGEWEEKNQTATVPRHTQKTYNFFLALFIRNTFALAKYTRFFCHHRIFTDIFHSCFLFFRCSQLFTQPTWILYDCSCTQVKM